MITGLLMALVVVALAGIGALLVGLYVTAAMPDAPPPAVRGAWSVNDPSETTAPPTPAPAIDPARNRQLPADAMATRRWAFLPNDINALAALKRRAGDLDAVVAERFILARGDDGRPTVRAYPESERALGWLVANAPDLEVFATVTSRLTGAETLRTVAHPTSRAWLVDHLVTEVVAGGFDGLVIELDGHATAQSRIMATLLSELAGPLRATGARLLLAVSAAEPPHALQQIAPLVDAVLLHAHGSYRAWDAMAPPASQAWFEDRLAAALAAVPRDKLVVSIGSYGVDPRFDDYRRIVAVQRCWDLARSWGGEIRLDRDTLNAYLAFRHGSGRSQRLWILDAVSAFNQTRAAMAAGVHGVALWRLGTEDPGVWSFLARGRLPNAAALAALRSSPGGHGSLGFAGGALIGVGEGEAGERDLAFHAGLGLVTDQRFGRLPAARRVTEWPMRAHDAVALTFDDGPDPRFTPAILDILAAKDAKASFFLLGSNALAAGNVTRRIYAEGHDVGNHTWSHLDTAAAETWRNALELNATQRVIEGQIGVHAKLFRPPYAHNGYGYLAAAPTLLEAVAEAGYLIAGYDVDSLDYATPSAEAIRARVVNGVLAGGRVVLMHDGAGDRRPTVEALPLIIDDLRTAGFRFVALRELAGLDRAEVMPARPRAEPAGSAARELRALVLAVGTWFNRHFPALAIAAAGLGLVRLLAVVAVAFSRREPSWRAAPDAARPAFTVLVPAFNEEKVIVGTVASLLESTIAEAVRICVVDDGSTDRTTAVVEAAFADDPRVRVLKKPNGGKAAALNYGLTHADTEVVVCIDGDTVLDRDTLARIVAPFADPRVGAVAGKVVVGNRKNLLTRFQALEYAVAQNLDRRAFERFNAIGVVPGAIGAWRRRAVLEVGGYSTDTLAEDADLTVSLERRGWRVVAENTAIARTEAPERLRPLVKQRFRWTFGTLQMAWKHRGAWASRPTGVACITLPNVFVFQFGFTLLAPIMDILLVVTVATALATLVSGAAPAAPANLVILAQFWLVFQLFDVAASAAGVVRDPDRSLWRLLPLIVVQRFTYRQLLYWVAVKALLAALKGTLVGWGKLARTGTVTLPANPALSGSTCSLGDRP